MLIKKPNREMGKSESRWLKSTFHFSFAEYLNPENTNFGVLRVLNDDMIQSHSGFPAHPHKDMEIITYIIYGELTHKDSMGNEEILTSGDIQYMSAGTGITHSEYNFHHKQVLRLLQIWIYSLVKNLKPIYGSHRFRETKIRNTLLHVVTSHRIASAPINIYQDVNMYISKLDANKTLEF